MGEPAFELPDGLLATTPPEARGVPRDGVRMLVAGASGLHHRIAGALPAVLRPGDLVVLNTSDTLPAAVGGVTTAGERVEVHLSTLDPAAGAEYPAALRGTVSRWVVEVRTPGRGPDSAGARRPLGGEPSRVDRTGAEVRLAGGGVLRIDRGGPRLWTAEL